MNKEDDTTREDEMEDNMEDNMEDEMEKPDVEIVDEASNEGTPFSEDIQKKCDELVDKLQRTMADFDNFRKRTAKEKTSMYDDGVRDTIEKLLPVIDNFERAMSADSDKTGGFYKGIEMIYRQLMVAFDDIGIEVLPGAGEQFDLNIHHAVMHVDDTAFGENEVIEEFQKGYRYKDRVIRHSMVKVAN